MMPNSEQNSPNHTLQYALVQKAQQKLEQFIPKYQRLVKKEKKLQKENQQLREEIEHFNRELIEREKELEQFQNHFSDVFALLRQIKHEEQRSPAFHPRPPIRHRFLQQSMDSPEHEALRQKPLVLEQDILPLNIWLVSRNRFVEQIVSYYTRRRERLLIIENYQLVTRLIEVGLSPDIIITGAYDFGLDDPFHQSFFDFLEHRFYDLSSDFGLYELFVITLSASTPAKSDITKTYEDYHIQHKYISKLHGLQITVSELRFFLEIRRCQPDIMEAEITRTIYSMEEVTQAMRAVQKHQKTGLLVVFSDESPPDIRWAFQLVYLRGKLVKTDHTLESSVLITPDGEIKQLERSIIFTSFDSQYKLNPPHQLLFFPLYDHTVLREIEEERVPLF